MPFASNDESFRAVEDLAAALEADGCDEGAAELRKGLSSLNGLTDGWALLLESLQRVQTQCDLEAERSGILSEMISVVHAAVYRR